MTGQIPRRTSSNPRQGPSMRNRTTKPARRKRQAAKPSAEQLAAQASAKQAAMDAKIQLLLDVMIDQARTQTSAAMVVGIAPSTARDHLRQPRWKEAYRMARELAAHRLVDQAEEALNPDNDGANLAPHQVTLRIARAKQKLWRAGRLNPEFAEKHVLTHEGSAEKPVQHNVVMTPSEAYQRMLGGK